MFTVTCGNVTRIINPKYLVRLNFFDKEKRISVVMHVPSSSGANANLELKFDRESEYLIEKNRIMEEIFKEEIHEIL